MFGLLFYILIFYINNSLNFLNLLNTYFYLDMKKFVFGFILFFSTFGSSFSQCTADFIYTSLGLPGVYPPSIQIPGSPIPLGISDGQLGNSYNQTLTVVILEDTSLDIAFLLPSAAVTAMNIAGISTTMTLDVNHVTFDVQDLPNGLSYQCDQLNCEYPSSVDGCIQINGVPTQAGNFSIPVNMSVNIQIPAITDPVFGTVIFPATAMDIPTFQANQYDLFIADGTTSLDEFQYSYNIFPNPSVDYVNISFDNLKHIQIYNSLGDVVFNEKVYESININSKELGKGVFIVNIIDDKTISQKKLIIQ